MKRRRLQVTYDHLSFVADLHEGAFAVAEAYTFQDIHLVVGNNLDIVLVLDKHMHHVDHKVRNRNIAIAGKIAVIAAVMIAGCCSFGSGNSNADARFVVVEQRTSVQERKGCIVRVYLRSLLACSIFAEVPRSVAIEEHKPYHMHSRILLHSSSHSKRVKEASLHYSLKVKQVHYYLHDAAGHFRSREQVRI